MSIVREGYPFIFISAIVGFLLLILSIMLLTIFNVVLFVLGIIFLLLSLFCIYFFRDPFVEITKGEDLIISPCNGTVLEVGENEKEKIIRVFLSVLDVHLQRSPVCGIVQKVEHKAGKFLKAMDPQAHIVNEQNIIHIKNDQGVFIVKQIAGILARRCVSWVKAGDILKTGDKIGVIKFSSQVDLHFPKNIEVKIKAGDKVVSGVTVFGEIK
ncbi:MAG: phosphatidylserine decarboxylase [Elusimicrobiota bacterium]|jgi:phosphatidylserine decarboxylase|nr:phosphatidylserine decarboxylase [Elusimicrobiota bacterium]